MKTKRILLLLLPVLMTGIQLITGGCSPKSSNQLSAEKTIWTCSMHPQIRQDHPGDCPICGMQLVPLKSVPSPQATASPEVAGTNPPSSLVTPPKEEANGLIQLDAAQSSVASIRTAPVEERSVRRKIELFGEIAYVSDRHVDFTWYYGGRVQNVLINFNTTEVSAGTSLLEVYSDEAIADQRSYLETLRQRWLATFYERKNYDSQLAAIKERLIRAGISENDVKALEKSGVVKSTFIIRAPRSGTILGAIPHAGERFTPDKVLFQLVPLDEVWFVADVYEHDIGMLKLGQGITIRCQARPDQTFKGKLVYIDREVNPQKRTIKARFLVPNPGHYLLPQLSATGTLEAGEPQPMLAIPSSAVIETGKRQLVYVEKAPHTYELRPVTVGAEGAINGDGGNQWVPVASGLKAGENVVVSGAFLIDAEAQMRGMGSSMDPTTK